MNNKIISIFIILLLLITIPLFTVKNKTNNKNFKKDDIYYIVEKASEENYHPETLKALAVIIQTNIKCGKKYNIKKVKISDKVKEAVDEVYNIKIKVKDKYIYIPYKDIINKGAKKQKYSYIKDYANPYDLLDSHYNTSEKSQGISINTLNHLCENGLSYNNALNYFLKDIKLTEK